MSILSFLMPKKTTIGFLSLDILVTESLRLPSEVTKYPVEDGSEDISDHITRNNEELSITGRIASSEILSFEFGPCHTKMVNAIDQLRQMHKARKPISIVTGLGKYEEMAFTSLTINRSNGGDGGNWLDINADLRKIKKVSLKSSTLPEEKATGTAKGKAGDTANRGKKGTEQFGPPTDDSAALTIRNTTNTYRPGTLPVGPGNFK